MSRRLFALLAVGAVASLLAREQLPDWAHDPRYWWRTPDQVGVALYRQGAPAQALRHLRAADWRGTACYRSADLACAEAAFAHAALLPDHVPADLAFKRGNVAARAGRLAAALAHYDAALSARPEWLAARENRALVLAAMVEAQQKSRRETGGEPTLPPDGTVIDERGKQGKPGRIELEKLDHDAQAKLWLRTVRTDPGAFLRLRFAQEQRASEAAK